MQLVSLFLDWIEEPLSCFIEPIEDALSVTKQLAHYGINSRYLWSFQISVAMKPKFLSKYVKKLRYQHQITKKPTSKSRLITLNYYCIVDYTIYEARARMVVLHLRSPKCRTQACIPSRPPASPRTSATPTRLPCLGNSLHSPHPVSSSYHVGSTSTPVLETTGGAKCKAQESASDASRRSYRS